MRQKESKQIWLYAFIGILTTIVVLGFARLSYGVILPFMRDGLSISYREAGFLGTSTSLGYLATVLFAGIIAAKWGSKRTILTGISIATAGLIGLAFTPVYWVTLLCMLLLGVGTAFTYTPLISMLVAWFPEKKGLIIGLSTSGVGISMLLTGVLVPYLDTVFANDGWRIAWGIYASVGLVVTFLIFLFIHNPPTMQQQDNNTNTKSVQKSIYRNPHVVNVALIYGIIGIAYIIQIIFIMSFMVESGINIIIAGQLMALNGILSIFSGPIWGFISDKIGRKKSLHITMALVLVAMCLPIVTPTLLGFTVHIILLSCTLTGLFTLIQAACMDQVKPAHMPIAFSYATFYFASGQLIGPTIAGFLIEDWGGFQGAFLFSSAFLAIGLLLTFKVRSNEEIADDLNEVQQAN